MVKQPILSICIPIYNRLFYLEKMLYRFWEDKDLFDEKIYLFIADNCSQDDLQSCCAKFQTMGLNLCYHRNDENIGPDRNFELCFHSGKGKYTWLLGSDDIPVSGFLRRILAQLERNDYGLFHLSMRPQGSALIEFRDCNEMAVAVNYWITFMSANIIRTDTIDGVDFSSYRQSNMIQVPAYLNACTISKINAVSFLCPPFEKDSDADNNGGYNLFKVFVTNLFAIYENFVDRGLLSQSAFDEIKKIEFKEFLSGFIVRLLIFRTNKNFEVTDGWNILRKYYKGKPYEVCYLIKAMIVQVLVNIKSFCCRLLRRNRENTLI